MAGVTDRPQCIQFSYTFLWLPVRTKMRHSDSSSGLEILNFEAPKPKVKDMKSNKFSIFQPLLYKPLKVLKQNILNDLGQGNVIKREVD